MTIWFQAPNIGSLRERGLQGDIVWVACSGGVLDLRGQTGALQIAPEEVTRLRIGYSEDDKRRSYQAKLWLAGARGGPLVLSAFGHTWPAYVDVLRAFAAAMAGKGLLSRVETGSSRFDALLPVVLLGLLAVGAVSISLFVLRNEPWWGRMLVPVVPLALFALFVWLAVNRSWPRPARHLDDLEKQFPPVAGLPRSSDGAG